MYIVAIEKNNTQEQDFIPEFFYTKEEAEKYGEFFISDCAKQPSSFKVYEVKQAD